MRNLVFSKFFKNVAVRFKAERVSVSREGIEVMGAGAARFDWPTDVSFDGAPVTVEADTLRSVLELAEAHGGLSAVDCELLPVEGDDDGKEIGHPAMMHVRFADGSGYDCEGAARDDQYDSFGVRAKCGQGDPLFAVTMDSGEFARAFKLVEPCVSKEEQRPVLTAVDMDIAGGMLRLQSTDRFRMAVACVRGAVIERDGGKGFDCFARAKFLKLFTDKTIGGLRLEYRKDDYGGAVSVGCMVAGWNVFMSAVSDGEFPSEAIARCWTCKRRDDNGYGRGFVCDVKQLKDVVAKLKTGRYDPLCFSMAANGVAVTNKLGMSYQLPGVGCVGASSGETVTSFYLNPAYVSELLARVAALGKSVEFLTSTGYSGVWIGPVVDVDAPFETTGLGGEGYLLMPMCGDACDFAGGEVNPVGVFRPDAPKIKPVFGLVDAPDWAFVDSITSKSKRSKSKRSKREPIKPEPVKPETEPEPVASEPVPRPQQPMSELGGHTIVEFAHEFDRIYGVLYAADGNGHSIDYESDIDAFDNHEYPRGVLETFNAYREDFVSSDRESAAFIRALRSFTPVEGVAAGSAAAGVVEPEPVTAEIPEVPPKTEPHEVVATSSAVMVRKVVIPGGKSVKELSDVFGGFKHKPRGFRDSKGRRVAYVAFDGTGGVIAYRDYYTDVDTRLEEQIADYLAAHNLKLAA